MTETHEQQIDRLTQTVHRVLTEHDRLQARLAERVGEVARLTRERDEAREAAQYLYDNVDLRGTRERWPWLRDTR